MEERKIMAKIGEKVECKLEDCHKFFKKEYANHKYCSPECVVKAFRQHQKKYREYYKTL